MKKIITLFLVFITLFLKAQDIKPVSVNFKSLPTFSLSYFTTDSTVWVWKGSAYGWTKLASHRDVKHKVDSLASLGYTKIEVDALLSRFRLLNNHDSLSTLQEKSYNSLDNKPDLTVYVPKTTTVNGHALTGNISVTKADLNIENVDNTSDANKPISTATQTALNAKLDDTQKGAANGLAELGADGFVLNTQLPSYVDDVLEYSTFTSFPLVGEVGKIYVAKDTEITYRWSGTGYTEISPTIALGETSATAYRGDRGKIAYDHSQSDADISSTNEIQTITLSGDVSGSGTGAITAVVADDSHNHVISNVDDLQTALDGKQPLGSYESPLTFSTGLSRSGNTITNTITQYTDARAQAAIGTPWTGYLPLSGGTINFLNIAQPGGAFGSGSPYSTLTYNNVQIHKTWMNGDWSLIDEVIQHSGDVSSRIFRVNSIDALTIDKTGLLSTASHGTSANWNEAYADRFKWDGGATGLTASTGRTSLGLGSSDSPTFSNVTATGFNTSAGGFVRSRGQQLYDVSGMTASHLRWDIESVGSETGSNVGSDYHIYRYADNGDYLGSAFDINRATGNVTMYGNVTASNLSGTNTGDNAVNSLYSSLVSFPGFGTSGSTAAYGNHSHSGYLNSSFLGTTWTSDYIPYYNGDEITNSVINQDGDKIGINHSAGFDGTLNITLSELTNRSACMYNVGHTTRLDMGFGTSNTPSYFELQNNFPIAGTYGDIVINRLGGTLLVGGFTADPGVSSKLAVDGDSYFDGNAYVSGELNADIISAITSITSTGTITGDGVSSNSDVTASGNVTAFVDMSAGGSISAGTSVYANGVELTSDSTLKKNIKPIENLTKFNNLKFHQAIYKSDSTDRKRYVVIAQEVEKIAPELVSKNKDNKLVVNYIDLLIAKVAQMDSVINEQGRRIKELEKRLK